MLDIIPFQTGDKVKVTLKGRHYVQAQDGWGIPNEEGKIDLREFPRQAVDFGGGMRSGRIVGHYHLRDRMLRTPENPKGISLLNPSRYAVAFRGKIIVLSHLELVPDQFPLWAALKRAGLMFRYWLWERALKRIWDTIE